MKRDVIRKGFKKKYFSFNVSFIYLLVTLTIRTFTYVGLRMTTREKLLKWVYIKPGVFYLTYVTDIMIVFGVLNFIYQSAPLKEKDGEKSSADPASIFPNAQGPGAPAQDQMLSPGYSSDGDKYLSYPSSND